MRIIVQNLESLVSVDVQTANEKTAGGMKEYKIIESWDVANLSGQINEFAKKGYELKFYQCHKDGNVTNEKHFAIMEKDAAKIINLMPEVMRAVHEGHIRETT